MGLEGGKYLVSLKEEDRDHSLPGNIGASFSDREINRILGKSDLNTVSRRWCMDVWAI